MIELESLEQIQAELDDTIGEFGVTAYYGGQIYRVLYETLDGFGDSTIASGVIAIPDSENKVLGESSVNYLYRYNQTISKIKKYYGENYRNLKIVISIMEWF